MKAIDTMKAIERVEGLFGAAEAAAVLGMSRQAVYQAIKARTLKPDRHNPARFRRGTLDAYREGRLAELKQEVARLEQVIRST